MLLDAISFRKNMLSIFKNTSVLIYIKHINKQINNCDKSAHPLNINYK